jgi:hypothetical protein
MKKATLKSEKLALRGGPKVVPDGLAKAWPPSDGADRKPVLESVAKQVLRQTARDTCSHQARERRAWAHRLPLQRDKANHGFITAAWAAAAEAFFRRALPRTAAHCRATSRSASWQRLYEVTSGILRVRMLRLTADRHVEAAMWGIPDE